MKLSYIIGSLALPFLFSATHGQPAPQQQATVTKGYYAIGDHANKLSVHTVPPLTDSAAKTVTKGYYSIGTKNGLSTKKQGWLIRPRTKPVASKGYYTIGNQ